MSIMAEMFGASVANCFGQALLRHSCAVIRWKSRLSMIVSWRAISSVSMSTSLSFFKLRGTMGEGSGPGARFPTGRRAAPCICGCTEVSDRFNTDRSESCAYPLVYAFADLQSLAFFRHRRQGKLTDAIQQRSVEIFVVHIFANPDLQQVGDPAVYQAVSTRRFSKAEDLSYLARIGRCFFASHSFRSLKVVPAGSRTT